MAAANSGTRWGAPVDLSVARKQRRPRHSAAGAALERRFGQRQLRVGEELRHGLEKILQEGESREPLLERSSVTVTEVRMSPDLRSATAFVMPLGGANTTEVLAALNRCAGFLKGLLARQVSLRHTPSLAFTLDDSFDQAERIHQLLRRPEVARDLHLQPAQYAQRDDEV